MKLKNILMRRSFVMLHHSRVPHVLHRQRCWARLFARMGSFKKFVSEQLATVLQPSWSREEHLEKFYKKAKERISPEQQVFCEQIIFGDAYQDFWRDTSYPCKWKFSADNLLLLPNGIIGFIDLSKMGKRFWGYDLAWIFWPVWLHFSLEDFKKGSIVAKVSPGFF